MLTVTYVVLALLGSGYVVLSAFLGHTGDHAGDAGAHDAGGVSDAGGEAGAGPADMHYGVDASGHGTAAAGAASSPAFHFPFFSPLALAALFGALGGYGLVFKLGVGVSDGASLGISLPAALLTAYGVTYASFRLMLSSRGSSQIRMHQLPGSVAEVLTPIPEGGLGEVAAMVAGQRFAGPAREEHGRAVARGSHVKIVRMVGGTMVVKPEGPPASA